MSDQDLYIELDEQDTEGHGSLPRISLDDESWLRDRLGGTPGSGRVVLKASEDDVEGHGASTTLRLLAFDGEDDTEGHAISVHFPTRDSADAFRRRLLLSGALAGSIVLGSAVGMGLSSTSNEAPAGVSSGAAAAVGMDWTQVERPAQSTAGSTAGADEDATGPGIGGPTPR
jgi:hypothetical protein